MDFRIKPKASSVIAYQLPEHVRNENPLFAKVLQYYYEYLESEGGPYHSSEAVYEGTDPDTAVTDYTGINFLELLAKTTIPALPDNVVQSAVSVLLW